MAWWTTDGILQKAPAGNSIPTDITGKGKRVIPEGVRVIFDAAFDYPQMLYLMCAEKQFLQMAKRMKK